MTFEDIFLDSCVFSLLLPNFFFTAGLELTLLAWCWIRRLPPRYTEEVLPSAVRFAAESMLSAAFVAGVFREEPS